MGGQRLRLGRGRAAGAGVGQGEGALLLLLLLLLEAVFLHLSVQTVSLLLGHSTKLYSCVGGLMRAAEKLARKQFQCRSS